MAAHGQARAARNRGSVLAGRYRLERPVTTGGMGAVWLAHDERLSRPVAVKLLAERLVGDSLYVDSFRREAQVAARFADPHLVSVYDFGTGPDPFLIMEYVDGRSLAEELKRPEGFAGDAATLARDLLAALCRLHGAGIVHRDVKPGNVLLDSSGRARLSDFGIAQQADADPVVPTAEVLGTLAYMAPELKRGAPATPRSDLFAAGLVLWECSRGGRDHSVESLVSALTEPEPSRRPGSAREALALLDGDAAAATPSHRRGRAKMAGHAAAEGGRAPTRRFRSLRVRAAISRPWAVIKRADGRR